MDINLIFLVFILLVVFVYMIIAQPPKPKVCVGGYNPPKKKQTLAQRLTKEGWVLYTKSNCPWCVKQLQMFGGDACNLKKVDCLDCSLSGKDLKGCQKTWVYPSWVKGNRIEPGTKTLKELKALLT